MEIELELELEIELELDNRNYSYSLLLTPYSLLLTPYSLLPTPYSLAYKQKRASQERARCLCPKPERLPLLGLPRRCDAGG